MGAFSALTPHRTLIPSEEPPSLHVGVLGRATVAKGNLEGRRAEVAFLGGIYSYTHRLLSTSFLWFIFRILQGNPKKELLKSLWVVYSRTTTVFRSVWVSRPNTTMPQP